MNNSTMIERFWNKVAVAGPDECWEWVGAHRVSGYGVIHIPKRGKQMYAHRLSAAIHFGMFDRRLNVLHHCDNPPCVNPAHLYLGDQKDNVGDMSRRGRARNGNSGRTHCQRGHEFNAENTYVYPNGVKRLCRACRAGSACEAYR